MDDKIIINSFKNIIRPLFGNIKREENTLIVGEYFIGKSYLLDILPTLYYNMNGEITENHYIKCKSLPQSIKSNQIYDMIISNSSNNILLGNIHSDYYVLKNLIIIDDIQVLYNLWKELEFIEFLNRINEMKVIIIMSCSSLAYEILESLFSNYSVLTIFRNTRFTKDSEIICRHYYGVNKWWFKESLNLLPSFLQHSVVIIALGKELSSKCINSKDYIINLNKFIENCILSVIDEIQLFCTNNKRTEIFELLNRYSLKRSLWYAAFLKIQNTDFKLGDKNCISWIDYCSLFWILVTPLSFFSSFIDFDDIDYIINSLKEFTCHENIIYTSWFELLQNTIRNLLLYPNQQDNQRLIFLLQRIFVKMKDEENIL